MPAHSLPVKSPATRYRYGDRDDDARAAHSRQTRLHKHRFVEIEFPPAECGRLLELLADTPDVVKAAAALGVSHNLVYGRMHWDTEFRDQVEKVLAENCAAAAAQTETTGDLCGTYKGYRRFGGRCARCRLAKAKGRN
jgi:hypothetical protein